ncbi:MAG: hypothetical protein M3Q30_15330 [Actinomycetota bacterium]|nr:hypothetical protein [Actinomycetota bacterium]
MLEPTRHAPDRHWNARRPSEVGPRDIFGADVFDLAALTFAVAWRDERNMERAVDELLDPLAVELGIDDEAAS